MNPRSQKSNVRHLALAFIRSVLALSACALATSSALFAQNPRVPEVSSFGQFYSLEPSVAQQGLHFRVKCTLLCVDNEWGQFYVLAGKETVYLDPRAIQTDSPLQAGHLLEITGLTTSANGKPALTNLNATILGSAVLPAARRFKLSELAADVGSWIDLGGIVRTAETSSGRLMLTIQDGNRRATVYIMGTPKGDDFTSLMDRTIRVKGINASKIVEGRLDSAVLMAPGIDAIQYTEEQKPAPLNEPVIAIGTLLARSLGSWTNNRVHVNGMVVSYTAGKNLVVKDPSGAIKVAIVQQLAVKADQRVDVWGFLRSSPRGPILDFGYYEPFKKSANSAVALNASGTNRPSITLTNVGEILKLERNEAARGYPVHLRGVVTFADSEWQTAFLQDRTGGIYFGLNGARALAGDFVELTGRTGPGGFAADINDARFKKLGISNLPPALKVTLQELANGAFDAQWIEMEGVVRRVEQQWGHAYLTIVTRQGKFRALVPGLDDNNPPQYLVDAIVRIQGACTSEFNALHQLIGITLQTPDLKHVQVLDSAPSNPFASEAIRIADVATFNADRPVGRRLKISGVVTVKLSQTAFVVQDASAGIRVQTAQAGPLNAGDRVDVLGYSAIGEYSPELQDAVFRVNESGARIQPRIATAERILSDGTNDQQVVRLNARLLEAVPRSASPEFILQDGSIIFTALTRESAQKHDFSKLKAGTILQLTGVCSIQGGEEHVARGFRLYVTRPEDIQVIATPPWWADARVIWITAGFLALALISAAWGFVLARKNRLLKRARNSLRKANDELELRVEERTKNLQQEIAERKQAEAELEKVYKQLLTVSRQAGMAEVATSVLHNVGNVLNSVNVSSSLLSDRIKKSRTGSLNRIALVLQDHSEDLASFLTEDPRGKQLAPLLNQLAERLAREQAVNLEELDSLSKNIDHIKDIVGMQQTYAKVSGVRESISVSDLVEDALRMNASSLARHNIQVLKEFQSEPVVVIEKHKVLQILVNLVRNAQQACEDAAPVQKQITLRITSAEARILISVADNGIGIPEENLTRIFSHGFTTRKNGHGFGLHSGALAARELGGALNVQSFGSGRGATFTLELPLDPTIDPTQAEYERDQAA